METITAVERKEREKAVRGVEAFPVAAKTHLLLA